MINKINNNTSGNYRSLVPGLYNSSCGEDCNCESCNPSGKNKTKTEIFIKKAKKVHGDKYSYRKVDYVNFYTKITITCRIHGDFLQTPNNHLNGSGCPRCKYDNQKSTLEEFIEKAKKVHGENRYDYSKVNYINSNIKVTIICRKHNKEFLQTPRSHLSGSGCPRCKCDNQKSTFTLEDFIEKAKKVHGDDRYDYSKVDYVNYQTKVSIVCKKHGIFLQTPNNHLKGHGCPRCGNTRKSTLEEFIEKAKKVHGDDRYDYSKVDYVNAITKTTIICRKHNKEFLQTPNSHLSGAGCPMCNSSRMEIELKRLLIENDIDFKEQWNWDWLKYKSLQYVDFYLPEYNIAIECQGIQHFKSISYFGGDDKLKYTQERDENKLKLCRKHGIKVLYYSNLGEDFPYPYNVITDIDTLINEIKKVGDLTNNQS